MSKTKAVDLSIFDVVTPANEGFRLDILKPNGEKSGVFFHLLGKDSDAYQELERKQQQARLQQVKKTGKQVEFDPEEFESNEVEKLVAATAGWANLSVEFSKAAAEDIYRDKRYAPIRDQVWAAVHNRANFTKG